MTIWDVLRAARRVWIVTLSCLLATGSLLAVVWNPPGTYVGQVAVSFLAPANVRSNALVNTTASLISTAGIVGMITGGPGGTARPVSDQVSIVGAGVEVGYTIQQPNAGGQWEYRFEVPTLDVQSAGRTLLESQSEMSKALNTIESALYQLESGARVASDQRISIQMVPTVPTYGYHHGSRSRALAASVLIGVLGTFACVLAADRIKTRRIARVGGTSLLRRRTGITSDSGSIEVQEDP